MILLLLVFAYSEEHTTDIPAEEPAPEPEPEPAPEEEPDVNVTVPPEPEPIPDLNVDTPPDTGEDENVVITVPDENGTIDVPDENVTIPDENVTIPGDVNTLLSNIIFVSPIEFQILNGIEVIIASLQNFDEIVSQWFSINGIDFNAFISGNTLTTDINTLGFEDGVYDLEANACTEAACFSESISITIQNGLIGETSTEIPDDINDVDETPIIEPVLVVEEELFSIIPGNLFSALSVFDLNGNLVDSSTVELFLEGGTYNAKLTFLDGEIESITMDGLIVDSNILLVEVDENISLDIPAPANQIWDKIIGVNPKANFSSGELNLKVPVGAEALYKCAEWNFSQQICEGTWEKLLDLDKEQAVSISFFPNDPGFGFASNDPGIISFNRNIACPKCGQHKVSPKTTVTMTVTANASEEIQNGVLEDFFPVDWEIVAEGGGSVSDFNSEFRKIQWGIGKFSGEISRTYQIFSPERTTPPTDYYFLSSAAGENSGYWRVKVADPAIDENITVGSCAGGTTVNSCAGLATIEGAQDVINNKNITMNATMNDGSYTDSINSVTFWVNHSGASGISGSVQYTLRNGADTVTYCATDATIPNTTTFTLDSDPGCAPSGGWTAAKLDDLVIDVRNSDGGQGQAAYYDQIVLGINYNPNGNLEFSITNPSADSNTSVDQDVDFLVDGTTTCRDADCGSVDTNVQYCIGAGCSGWLDLNTVSTSPLYIVFGSQPQNSASLTQDSSYSVSWVLQANVAQNYELRFRGDGSTADVNTTNGTDRTITIQAVANDFSFTLSLPSSGCTEGEGSTDAGADCEKGYFETTDIVELADETKVDAQGQASVAPPSDVPFFVFDNQSSTSSDFNITLDLNAALPGTLELKASNFWNGWEATCGDAPSTGCVDVTTLAPSAGKAVWSAGTLDLNIFLWADFTAAGFLTEDRIVTAVSVAS